MSDNQRKFISAILAGDPRAIKTVEKWIQTAINCTSWMRAFNLEEIRQETMLALIENLRNGDYRDEGLRAYVERICKNKCIDALRQRKHGIIDCAVDLESVDPPSDSPDPGEKLDRTRRIRVVREGLRQLKPECRQLIRSAFMDNLNGQEGAKRLGISHTAYRQRLFKCMDQLREFCRRIENGS